MPDRQEQVKRVTMSMTLQDYERMKELQDMLGLENGATAVSSALLLTHRLAERTRAGADLYVQDRNGWRERVRLRLRPARGHRRRATGQEAAVGQPA